MLPHCVVLSSPPPPQERTARVSICTNHTFQAFLQHFVPRVMGHWLVMTRDLKYLPASIPWPQGSMDPAIEPLRAPSWPSDEVGSSNCSRQEGQEITPGFGRSRTGRGRSSGRASQRPRIDLESKVRPGRNSSRSFSPLESPLHPTLLIPGASWLRSSQRPPRSPAGNGQVERDRSSAPHPGRRGQAEPAPGGVQSAAATPALLPLAPPPGVPGRLAPATGEAAASPRRLRGAVPPRPPLARPSPRPLPSARPAPPPLATRGLISPGLPLRGPCAARKPTRRGAGRAVHSLDARRGRTGPGGSPPPVLVPAPPRSPPPRAGVPGLRAARPARTRRGSPRRGGPGSGVTMEEPQRARSHTVTTTASSFAENFSTTSSSFAYDREFLRTLPGLLIVAEIVLGLLVWTLIAGTEYFRVPAFGWVMFVAVFYWVLTVFFLIIYITMTYTRIPQVPWTTVVRTWIGWSLVLQSIWDRLCPQRRGQSQGETARNLEIQLPFKYFRSETACWKVQNSF
uniref:MARVEL domain-containing protein n=1 Tax=Sus scrofa TaxID=9823 RepID=A0A4X1UER8_PIG